ncbi:MAG: phage portal protein [Actinomycetia bacterium]|nr:phage portal protein [Actinomycetes bacterium]
MSSLLARIRGDRPLARSQQILDGYFGGLDDGFMFNGVFHPTMGGSPPDRVGAEFEQQIVQVHNRHGIIAAAVLARQLPLSQCRFRWRVEHGERSGQLIGTADLAPLEGAGRPGLLSLAERHVSYAGNAFFVRRNSGRVGLLRPDWVDVMFAADPSVDGDTSPVGYVFWPGGDRDSARPVMYHAGQVGHWMPEPRPLAPWLGESWVSSVIREIVNDGQATDHVSKFFDNAATANMVITAAEGLTRAQFDEWRSAFDTSHRGASNAWKNVYLSHGTDVNVVGSGLGDLAMAELQGGFETRFAVRSRVPATMLGIREGMAGSALNSGNYGATRRMWADGFFTPYAESLCAALETVVVPPNSGLSLTFDPDRVLLLQEDRKDAADILATQAGAINTLYAAGFKPDAIIKAVTDGQLTGLVGEHTGLSSVQLLPPADGDTNNEEPEPDGEGESNDST